MNHILTVCSLGNIPAKNYRNRLMYFEVIASQMSVVLGHSVVGRLIGKFRY